MAGQNFTPAGVDLQAKGFQQYIKQLETIDKKQREVFDTKFKDTSLSYNQVTKAARDYEKQVEKAARQQSAFNNLARDAAIGFLSRQTAEAAIEAAKAAAAFRGQRTALDNLAGGYGLASKEIRDSIRQASKGTISEAQIIQTALSGLQLDVANTADEFGRLVAAGRVLGQARGIGAQEGIERLVGGIGRREVELLDELGIAGRQINIELERLAQERFDSTAAGLSNVQREALFVEAALTVAEEKARLLGDAGNEAQESFDRLNASLENTEILLGEAIRPGGGGLAELFDDALTAAQRLFIIVTAGAQAANSAIQELGPSLAQVLNPVQALSTIPRLGLGGLQSSLDTLGVALPGPLAGLLDRAALGEGEAFDFSALGELDDTFLATFEDRFKALAETIGVTFDDADDGAGDLADGLDDVTEATEDATNAANAYASAVNQAQDIQRSFARQQEDNARQQARQQEDNALRLARQQEDNARRLARDFANLEKKRLEQITDLNKDFNDDLIALESDGAKDAARAQEDANKERVRAQEDLHRQLRQAEERFNLSRVQSQRRFNLSDRRLRADGDILALQELRENFDLQQQEEKENFDQQQRQTKEGGEAQARRQSEDIQERIAEQQEGLEKQRQQLQEAFNENLTEIEQGTADQRQKLQEAEQERIEDQRIALERQTEDQQIALARQNEDQQIALQRRLEDLGFALAQQADVTQAGAAEIANRLEEVFGMEGTAELVLGGFFERSRSGFQDLVDDIEDDVERLQQLTGASPSDVLGGGNPSSPARLPGFQAGGAFTVGGTGGPDSQVVAFRATPGERVSIETPQQFSMPAPIAALQSTLNVQMSGGFDINGADGAGRATVEAALDQMVDEFSEVVRLLARRS